MKSLDLYRDRLTGNKTRIHFEHHLYQLMEEHQDFTLLLMSIDRFGMINEFYGHRCGDKILKTVGATLESLTWASVYRFSGSQFVLVIATHDKDEINAYIKEARQKVRLNGRLKEINMDLSLSAGVVLSESERTLDTYYDQMNIALRHAKAKGKGGTQYYNERIAQALKQEMTLEGLFDQGINHDEFQLFFQPLYRMKTEKTVGYEVLVRWFRTEELKLNIGQIIEKAEASGKIIALDCWVIDKTFETISKHRERLKAKKICVNISPQSFLSFDFLKFFMRKEEEYGIDMAQIELEITEYTMIHDLQRTIQMMNIYKSRGLMFALDDFGTKYSSINYLKELPLDVLKIDKSYIDKLVEDSRARIIVQTLLQLCCDLGLETIAEGIESQEQWLLLKDMGCDLVQGYYMAKPMPVELALSYLNESA